MKGRDCVVNMALLRCGIIAAMIDKNIRSSMELYYATPMGDSVHVVALVNRSKLFVFGINFGNIVQSFNLRRPI